MRFRILILIVCFSCTILVNGQPKCFNTEPCWSPCGKYIVFVSERDGNYEIYVMNKDGSNQIRLTKTLASESNPSWSPNGTKILFHSERTGVSQIYSMNLDGSNQINLTNSSVPEYNAMWSPLGNKILFNSVRDQFSQAYIMNPDGSNQTRIINTNTNLSALRWSNDGCQIACLSFDVSALNMVHIAINICEDTSYQILHKIKKSHSFYEWSQDLNKILYSTKTVYSPIETSGHIYIYDQKSYTKEQISKNINGLIKASFSPDEKKILFETRENVYILTLGEKKPFKVGKKFHSAQWSPDGKTIVLVSRNVMNIYTVNPDGTNLKQLTFKN